MSRWTAIVPINLGGERKTRLAPRLSRDQRNRLAEGMARHVIGRLLTAETIGRIRVLSPQRPDLSGVDWAEDAGRGLNSELAPLLVQPRTLVIHADLPLLQASDIAALLAAAEQAGAALAPDRTGLGTNALALAQLQPLTPGFGHGSLARHRTLLPEAAIVEIPGLALDVDTPDDLDAALAMNAPGIASGI